MCSYECYCSLIRRIYNAGSAFYSLVWKECIPFPSRCNDSRKQTNQRMECQVFTVNSSNKYFAFNFSITQNIIIRSYLMELSIRFTIQFVTVYAWFQYATCEVSIYHFHFQRCYRSHYFFLYFLKYGTVN